MKQERCELTKLDRRMGCPHVVARLGHLLDANVEQGIGPAYSRQFFFHEMSTWSMLRIPSPLTWMRENGSPCTHVVIPGPQCQVDTSESIECKARASVELLEDPG